MGEPCPSGSVERIVFHRSSCMHTDPTSGTVEHWTTRMGPACRTSNRESSSRPLYPAVPASHGAAVTRSAGSAPAEPAGKLECSSSWTSARISSRILPSGSCSVVRFRKRGAAYRTRSRSLFEKCQSCVSATPPTANAFTTGPTLRKAKPYRAGATGGHGSRVCLQPNATISAGVTVEYLDCPANVLGDMGPWVGLGAPRIHSGTFALNSAGRDRIGLAWGTVPQAR